MMYEMTYMNKGYDDKLYNKYKTHKNYCPAVLEVVTTFLEYAY